LPRLNRFLDAAELDQRVAEVLVRLGERRCVGDRGAQLRLGIGRPAELDEHGAEQRAEVHVARMALERRAADPLGRGRVGRLQQGQRLVEGGLRGGRARAGRRKRLVHGRQSAARMVATYHSMNRRVKSSMCESGPGS
jgi:hypothetical protein